MIAFFIASGLTVFCVGAFLLRAVYTDRQNDDDTHADIMVYRGQLDELDRDLERGLLTPDQADAARTEVSRRLLAASAIEHAAVIQTSNGRFASIAAIILCLGVVAPALYWALGSFGTSDLPNATRLATLEEARASRPSQTEAEEIALPLLPPPPTASSEHMVMVDRLRAVVADRPTDLQGLRLLARQEALLGNYVAAREALEKVVAAQTNAPEVSDLASLFDAMLFNANDYISPEAEVVLIQLRERAPDLLLGQFYEGMLEIQSGRADRAFPIWRDLLTKSPPDAPWVSFVRGEMAGVAAAAGVRYELPPLQEPSPGPTADDIAAASDMSAEDRQQMVEDMVSRLSDRLATEGGPVADWRRLVRALVVLGRNDAAQEIMEEAMTAFQSDAVALDQLRALRAEIGVD